MPLILPKGFPAVELLKDEGIVVQTVLRSDVKCMQPLRIAVLNLMPMKVTTEVDLVRLLSASPLTLDVQWMKLSSHVCKHAAPEHMAAFYRTFDEMKDEPFDGMIITGAPVEHLAYEQVTYWPELCRIFDWARAHMRSTLYICWAAQAGLYYHYGVPKYSLPEKMFGIFPQRVLAPQLPLFRGFDDTFAMPHSRHTELRKEDIQRVSELSLVAESPLSGVSIVVAQEGREVFTTGHSEYAPLTLDNEYRRDLGKGLPIHKPYNYYIDDDPAQGPLVTWRAHGNLLFQNWINHYVAGQ